MMKEYRFMLARLESLQRAVVELEAENKRLREENAKLRAEQVCHGDQCRIEESRQLRDVLATLMKEIPFEMQEVREISPQGRAAWIKAARLLLRAGVLKGGGG